MPTGRVDLLDLVDQLSQQVRRGRRVAEVAGGGSGRQHQLAVGSTEACPL
jgi:hypothetical protein